MIRKTLYAAAALLLVIACATFCSKSRAGDIHVFHDGVEVFCATRGPMGFETPYSFSGTCTPAPPPTACPSSPRARAATSNIQYLPDSALRRGMDLTAWQSIWGFITADVHATVMPWPGVAGSSPTILTLGKAQYLSAKFHVGAIAATAAGQYVDVSYGNGPAIDAAISTSCGDFAPADPACRTATPIPSQDQTFLAWKAAPGNAAHCGLAPNTDYYLNIRFHDAAPTGPGCSGNFCRITIQNFHN